MQDFKKYLNPLVRDLESVVDFSQVTQKNDLEVQEYPYLEVFSRLVVADVKTKLHHMTLLEEDIEKAIELINVETGDDKVEAVKDYNRLLSKMEDVIDSLNRVLESLDMPYFGKIIFDRRTSENTPARKITAYLGKFAYFDKTTNTPLVTDWRAPIANLYYQNAGPTAQVEFNSPVGIQKGDLTQKRQFEIGRARIHAIYDSKSGNVGADEFLLTQLTRRLGKKLTEIVATIQAQQNSIIREEINKPVVIQGVAGSGKTTIILHRLAYVFYTYAHQIRPELSLIIAPNTMFLDYISDVLPSLGVKGIEQNTYLFWAKNVLGLSDKYVLETNEDLDVKKFKGSQQFRKLIDTYFEEFENDLFEKMPGRVTDSVRLRYLELGGSHPDLSVKERLDLSVDFAFAQLQFKRSTAGNFMGELEGEATQKKRIREYLKRRTRVYDLYKNLFRGSFVVDAKQGVENWGHIRKITLDGLKSTTKTLSYRTEDLAGMLWLHYKISGIKDHQYEYVVVDEAQDLSVFQLLTLTAVAKNSNITIAGDLAQSIIPPFYIQNWEYVIQQMGDVFKPQNKISYHQLFRCYRTTVEIIEYANRIFKAYFSKEYHLPEAVLRHGDPVGEIKLDKKLEEGLSQDVDKVVRLINDQFEKGAMTVALICKNAGHADRVYSILQEVSFKLKNELFSYNDDNYHSGVLVLPVERAKGLEFDAVILVDAGDEYDLSKQLDVRLLYVAVTRALHRLFILTSVGVRRSVLLS